MHRACCGTTVVQEVLADLDYADDIALLEKIIEEILRFLGIMHEEAASLGPEINQNKTKIQCLDGSHLTIQIAQFGAGSQLLYISMLGLAPLVEANKKFGITLA